MIANQILLNAATVTSTNTSGIFDLGDLSTFCVGVVFTGVDAAGSLVLEASQDGTNFFTVTGSTVAITSATGHVYDVTASGYRYVRAKLTSGTGTGTMTVKLTAKQTTILGG